jgi:hypothetical protein
MTKITTVYEYMYLFEKHWIVASTLFKSDKEFEHHYEDGVVFKKTGREFQVEEY